MSTFPPTAVTTLYLSDPVFVFDSLTTSHGPGTSAMDIECKSAVHEGGALRNDHTPCISQWQIEVGFCDAIGRSNIHKGASICCTITTIDNNWERFMELTA